MKTQKPISKMTATEKAAERVAIAKDVIKQVHAGRMIVTHGWYLCATVEDADISGDMQLCDLLRGKKCFVCAKGALFLAKLDRHNHLTVTDVNQSKGCGFVALSSYSLTDYVADLFGRATFDKIEAFFEGGFEVDANAFYQAHPDPKARLLAIMRNIIANGGYFKPEKPKAGKP